MALEQRHEVHCQLPLLLADPILLCVVPQLQLPPPLLLLLLPSCLQRAQQAAAAGA
jgi:hypothetical protein